MTGHRKLIVYIAASLDGYIAQPNDDLTFLDAMHKEGEDYGYTAFLSTVDTVIMGRKTYDWVMKQVEVFPHVDKQTFIITRNPRNPIGNIQFYTNSLPALINSLKRQSGKHIFVDGGAEIVNELLRLNLIDELIVSVIPVILGSGTPLFQSGLAKQTLKLIQSQSYDTGLVQLHYACNTINQ